MHKTKYLPSGVETVGPATGCPLAMPGDATEDGAVTATDALYALNAAVGLAPCALDVCDASADGTLSAVYALRILQFAIGADVELL